MTLDLLTPLRDYGLTPIEEGDWRSRGRPGTFHPIGTASHHTANGQRANPTASLSMLINGRGGTSPLAGPLCNGYVDRLGRSHLIAGGRANHGGAGWTGTLNSVRNGQKVTYWKSPHADDGADGNAWYLGIEVENDGVGERYTDEQIRVLVLMNAAWADAFGWHVEASVHHRQHTARKVDMSLDLDLPYWTALTIWTHHVPTPPGPTPLPTNPEPWRYDDVNIVQIPVHVTLDDQGNGYADAACSISKVIGEPRLNGTLAVYNVSPSLRSETYGVNGVTRIEVQGGSPRGAVDFVVSAIA